ncbi:MAG TPA: NAD(P)-dependent oxidoreductase [Candidatus Eisenbacteria bacterium]|nr:NAD(P)-dependent oxidoreductase [Candidatus Eisenbacteria bacterium]
MDRMNVLITGGTGVNGVALARRLVEQKHRPVLLDLRKDLSLMRDIENQVELVIGDVCDRDLVEKTIQAFNITHIAHLAALMPEAAEADPRLAVKVGIEGTVNVLEAARAKSIQRVVFTSSKAVYGEIRDRHGPPECVPIDEEYRRAPADLYGVIKVCCEDIGAYYRRVYGLEFIALRYATIYAPGKEVRHGALSFYGQLIEKARSGETWVLPDGGDQTNDTVYVGDVARSIGLALTAEPGDRWVFNIGSGRASTPREFLDALAKLFPNHHIRLGRGPSQLGRKKPSFCVFDIAAARQYLGYEPVYDVEKGVRDYVATLERLGR